MNKRLLTGIVLFLIVFIPACTQATPAPTATPLPTALPDTSTPTLEPSSTPTFTFTPSLTNTPTETPTPSITDTPTITPTPTFDFPDVVVNQQAHCRYGPSKAYLHAADLYEGDHGEVRGRFEYSGWLRIQFDKLDYQCWVSSSVVDVTGDLARVLYITPDLSKVGYSQYPAPGGVSAVRDGNKVTITWNQVKMTKDKDRGYFIEAWVCQDGAYLWWTVSFEDQYTTSYTVKDDQEGCGAPSEGQIRTVEKHGYSEPATIPWP